MIDLIYINNAFYIVTNIPTKLSELTDDVVSGNYLPLSGGTLSGGLTLNTSGAISNLDTRAVNGATVDAAISNYTVKRLLLGSGYDAWVRGVIGLIELADNNTFFDSYSMGRIYFKRPNGLGEIAFMDYTMSYQYNSQHNIYATMINSNVPKGTITKDNNIGYSFCVFKQTDDKWYGGIEFMIAAANYNSMWLHYEGSRVPFYFPWYRTDTQTVLHTQFANSYIEK